jgi:triacylglycerol lipase
LADKFKKAVAAVRKKINATTVSGAIRGVIGDKLPVKWRGKMQFCESGKLLTHLPAIRRPHICIFVHGSADTELGWQAKGGELDFGGQLLVDFGLQPLYVRYNSGLSVGENGSALAELVDHLLREHKSIRQVTFIAHSMGGLVVHAAIYHARALHMRWPKRVHQVFLLGTPHAGAPLAKLAEKGEQLLQFIPNPITLIAASVIGLRSRGLKDLSLGQKGVSTRDAVLLPHATYVFVAGGLQKKHSGIFNRLIGDGMVRSPSALPKPDSYATLWQQIMSRLAKTPRVQIENLPGVGHLALRNSPRVYAILARHLQR